MAKFDPDRIAALASGSLDPAEAAALEAEIAADPRAAADLAAQRLALDALRRAPAPVLTAAERTELRRAVASALHLDEAPVPLAARRRRLGWRPLAVAAAALAAVIAVVPLLTVFSGDGNEASLTTLAALEATTLPRDAAFSTAQNAEAQEGLGAPGTLPEATALGGTLETADAPAARLATPAEKAVADFGADPEPLFAAAPAEAAPCSHEAQLLLRVPDPIPALLPLQDGTGEIAYWFVSDDGATLRQLLAFDPADCTLLAVYP